MEYLHLYSKAVSIRANDRASVLLNLREAMFLLTSFSPSSKGYWKNVLNWSIKFEMVVKRNVFVTLICVVLVDWERFTFLITPLKKTRIDKISKLTDATILDSFE